MSTSIWDNAIQAHSALDPKVRDVDWVSNCGSEIHIEDTTGESLRIGHFQGDAKLSEFAVAAHQATLRASRETGLHDKGSQLFRGRTPVAAAVQLGTVLALLTEQQLESLEAPTTVVGPEPHLTSGLKWRTLPRASAEHRPTPHPLALEQALR